MPRRCTRACRPWDRSRGRPASRGSPSSLTRSPVSVASSKSGAGLPSSIICRSPARVVVPMLTAHHLSRFWCSGVTRRPRSGAASPTSAEGRPGTALGHLLTLARRCSSPRSASGLLLLSTTTGAGTAPLRLRDVCAPGGAHARGSTRRRSRANASPGSRERRSSPAALAVRAYTTGLMFFSA